ncbi:MAG TPA: restriction endonuclease subunit S, partial [Pseudomonadota bacterium]|nr:restriction endonuclease subunit S [Pseudomonadota bacterium]
AAQPNVSVGSVQRYPLIVPPIDLLSEFKRLIDPVWGQTEILRDQLSNLRKQRDLLLPRLLSGQIDLKVD